MSGFYLHSNFKFHLILTKNFFLFVILVSLRVHPVAALPVVMASRAPLVDDIDGTPCGNGVEGPPCAHDAKALTMPTVAWALPVLMALRGLSIPTVARALTMLMVLRVIAELMVHATMPTESRVLPVLIVVRVLTVLRLSRVITMPMAPRVLPLAMASSSPYQW